MDEEDDDDDAIARLSVTNTSETLHRLNSAADLTHELEHSRGLRVHGVEHLQHVTDSERKAF